MRRICRCGATETDSARDVSVEAVGTEVKQLDELAAEHGDRYQPAQILRTHAADGTTFR